MRRAAVEMHDLAVRMHPGIGPSAGDDTDPLTEKDPERPFNLSLNRSSVVLNLPAVEVRSVILDVQR